MRLKAGTRSALQGAYVGLEYLQLDSAALVPPTEVPEVRRTNHDGPLETTRMAIGGSAAEDIVSVLSNPTSIIRSLKGANTPKPSRLGAFVPRQFFGNGLVPLPKA